MKKKPTTLYALRDKRGVYITSESPYADDEEQVILFPNPTWEQDDYTDSDGNHWIIADRLGELFTKLCEGLPVSLIAATGHVSAKSLREMRSGLRPVPETLWKKVEEIKVIDGKVVDLESVRSALKLTKAALALKFGVHPNTISNWCSGKTPIPQKVKKWALKVNSAR